MCPGQRGGIINFTYCPRTQSSSNTLGAVALNKQAAASHMHAGMGRKCLCRQILFLPPIYRHPSLASSWKISPPSPSEMQPANRFHIRAEHTQPVQSSSHSPLQALHNQYFRHQHKKYLYNMHSFGLRPCPTSIYETKLVTHWRFWFYVLTMSLFSDTLSTCEMWIYLFPWHTPLMLRCSALFGIYCSTFPAAEQTRLFFPPLWCFSQTGNVLRKRCVSSGSDSVAKVMSFVTLAVQYGNLVGKWM